MLAKKKKGGEGKGGSNGRDGLGECAYDGSTKKTNARSSSDIDRCILGITHFTGGKGEK